MNNNQTNSLDELRVRVQKEIEGENKLNETLKNLADQGIKALVSNDSNITLNKLDFALLKLMMIDYLSNSKTVN